MYFEQGIKGSVACLVFLYPSESPLSGSLASAMLKLSILAAFLTLSVASPLAQRDIWDPPVLSPKQGSILVSGTSFTVKWDTSNPPAEITDVTGIMTLAKDGLIITNGVSSKIV